MTNNLQPQWQVIPCPEIPQWFSECVKQYTPNSQRNYAAQLLWQRGIRDPHDLAGFVDAKSYQPTSALAFGQEMKYALNRIIKAHQNHEKVAIWGDFDADGITATSVLWEGLGEFFAPNDYLTYYIPNRSKESHGLNQLGIEKLADWGAKLIITCDTGSTNLTEIKFANQLGLDLIITDHHTLPSERPPVISILNPRYFSDNHPLYHLSGVAVAYKLVEALFQTLPEIPQQPLENLLDLVAIGLIADLVQLSGDCRYLAQKGIEKLKQQLTEKTRPGIAELLKLCQRNGDRPTDISFGLGPRINAVSRIYGDSSFCVELLTSKDQKRCHKLALETELANSRRQSLQKHLSQKVIKKLEQLDLSTTAFIILEDLQWEGGILGLVAGQIAQEYGRPTLLLTIAEDRLTGKKIARGSARSINNIDLYQLIASQSHLLNSFGGHPLAAGLSLPLENLELFKQAINQQLKQQLNLANLTPTIQIDLIVTVAELGEKLFQELRILEPYGMGNPPPKLLIKNCYFGNIWNKNIADLRGKKVEFIRTYFEIYDDSTHQGFPGIWWGHYQDELPKNQICDAIVELEFNPHQKRYEVRLLDLRYQSNQTEFQYNFNYNFGEQNNIIDWRKHQEETISINASDLIFLKKCPVTWTEIKARYRQAIANNKKLALVYPPPQLKPGLEIWKQLIGIAKYLSRTQQNTTFSQLQERLNLGENTLKLGLIALANFGFEYQQQDEVITLKQTASLNQKINLYVEQFFDAIAEEQFQKQYFYDVPLSTLETIFKTSIKGLTI
jgi:single-stranded-DNA-specific exonuclease